MSFCPFETWHLEYQEHCPHCLGWLSPWKPGWLPTHRDSSRRTTGWSTSTGSWDAPTLGWPPGGGTPILRRITWHYLEGEPQVLAAYQTSGMSLFAFLAQAGLSQLCLTPESNQCNLHIEGRIQLPLSPVVLQPGSLVEIFLHGPDIDDNSYDESSLMQQPKPSRSPDLIPLRLLGLNYVNVLFYANQEEALMTQLKRSWPLPGNGNPANLEAVHFVACPPTTLSSNQEHVYLLQQREDRFSQAHTNDVLILVTISFTAPGSRIQKARVVWGPRRATRPQLLAFLRLGWFCDQPTTICWIYLNNHPWLDQATVTRRLEYGDHIRVQIRSDAVQWSDIEYAEDVSCSMRLYQDSPPSAEPPDLHEAREEEEEERSEPLSRSRSRSRGRSSSRGVRHNVAADGEESDDASLSLIQTGVQKRWRQQDLSSAVDPHVSDRWCEKQSEASPACPLASDPDLHLGSVYASITSFSRWACHKAHLAAWFPAEKGCIVCANQLWSYQGDAAAPSKSLAAPIRDWQRD